MVKFLILYYIKKKKIVLNLDVIFHTFNKELRWGSKLSDMMRGIGEAIKMKYV